MTSTHPYKAVVAVSRNGVIGINGRLPWKIPKDLKWFKEITLGHTVLMGRKTWESLPFPLPGRRNWVLSKNLSSTGEMSVFRSLEDAELNMEPNQRIFIIGGGEIYLQALPKCGELYVTEVKRDIEDGDAFFPDFREEFLAVEVLDEDEDFILRRWVRKAQ